MNIIIKLSRLTYSIFLIFLFSVEIQAVEIDDTAWQYKDWRVDAASPSYTRFTTHGNNVYGHQFGMVKMTGSCEEDILFISWSAENDAVMLFKGQDITIGVLIDDSEFTISVSLISTFKSNFGSTILAFSNWMLSPDFIKELENGHNIKLEIRGPEAFVSLVAEKQEEFSLEGYIANRFKAQKACETGSI